MAAASLRRGFLWPGRPDRRAGEKETPQKLMGESLRGSLLTADGQRTWLPTGIFTWRSFRSVSWEAARTMP